MNDPANFYARLASAISKEQNDDMWRFELRQQAEKALQEFDRLSALHPAHRFTGLASGTAANLRGTLRTPWPPTERLQSLVSDLRWQISKLNETTVRAKVA